MMIIKCSSYPLQLKLYLNTHKTKKRSRWLRREYICVDREYSTLSCKCENVRVFCMPSSAKQKKTHKKHKRQEGTIQWALLLPLIGQTICKIPTSDIKYKKAFDNFTVWALQKLHHWNLQTATICKTALVHSEYRSIHNIQSKNIHIHK